MAVQLEKVAKLEGSKVTILPWEHCPLDRSSTGVVVRTPDTEKRAQFGLLIRGGLVVSGESVPHYLNLYPEHIDKITIDRDRTTVLMPLSSTPYGGLGSYGGGYLPDKQQAVELLEQHEL